MLSERTSIALSCGLFTIDSYGSFALLTIQPVRFSNINASATFLVANIAFRSQMAVTHLAILHSSHHFLSFVNFLIFVIVIFA